jgi:hypothetical protein
MNNWLAQHLRLTMFISGEYSLDLLWSLISSEPPEIDESRPREGSRRMASIADNIQLDLQSLPGRIDFFIGPAITPGVPLVVNIGNAKKETANFAAKVEAIFEGANFEIIRIAFGIVMHKAIADRNAGYDELSKLTSLKLNSENSRDFMLQINHPFQFKMGTESFELNRLTKWSSVATHRFSITAGNDNTPLVTPTLLTENFVRLEIDNSSPAEHATAFPKESLKLIFKKLVELASESANGIVL